MCFVLGFSIIFGSTLSVNAATPSLYNGTLVIDNFVSTSTFNYAFDFDEFNRITSLSGSEVEPTYNELNRTTRGSISHGSTSDSVTLIPGDTVVPSHTDSISLSVSSSNDIYYHVCNFDLLQFVDFGGFAIDPNKYYEVIPTLYDPYTSTGQFTLVNNQMMLECYCMGGSSYKYGPFTRPQGPHCLFKGRDLIFENSTGSSVVSQSGVFINFKGQLKHITAYDGTLRFSWMVSVYEISEEDFNSNTGTPVVDNQGNSIAQQNADTNKDTNNKITDFFSSFFDNLIHVFVPEDGFFSDWFNELNDFFAAKLGFLYAPFDFIISFFNGVVDSVGTQEHGFTIPALKWEDTEFCPEVHFSFDMFAEEFPQLQEAVYFFSDVVIILALMRGIRAKLDLVMGVHEE